MPAFDPVRDAVLNSPISSSLPLPSRMHLEMPHGHDTSPLPEPSPAPIVSPQLTRRATDLSVLLNDDPPPTTSQALDTPLFTPTTPRGPSGLSHLLSSEPAPDLERDQLASAQPLTRKAQHDRAGDRASAQQASYFAHRESASHAQRPRLEIKSTPIALSFPSQAQSPPRSPAVSTRQSPAAPPAPPSDSHTASLASSSSRSSKVQKAAPSQQQQQQPSASQPHSLPAMPPPATPLKHSLPPKPQSQTPPPPPPPTGYRSARPYAPRRITPATSVLVPLSSAEIERYKHWKGAPGTMILRKKTRDEAGDLKRAREDVPAEDEERRKKRRAGDVGIVVEHCAYC